MDAERARELLSAERARLEQAIAALAEGDQAAEEDAGEPGELGSQELLQRELDTGLGEDLAEQLDAVARAEERLAAGRYGLSIESGEPIPDERLEALPSAERTVAEQEAHSRR